MKQNPTAEKKPTPKNSTAEKAREKSTAENGGGIGVGTGQSNTLDMRIDTLDTRTDTLGRRFDTLNRRPG